MKRSLNYVMVVGGCLLAAGCQRDKSASGPVVTAPAGSESLPAADPVSILHKCLEHYDRQDVRTYRLIMDKQERIDRKLHPPEVVEVFYRARPHSVLTRWLQGERRARSALYVEGENDGKVLIHPTGLIGRFKPVVAVDPDGPLARAAGRYGIKDFGLRETLERT
jgi:hypothetical protein